MILNSIGWGIGAYVIFRTYLMNRYGRSFGEINGKMTYLFALAVFLTTL